MVNQNEKNNVNDYFSIRRVFYKNGEKFKSLTLLIKPDEKQQKFSILIEGLPDSEDLYKKLFLNEIKKTRNCLYVTISKSFCSKNSFLGYEPKYKESEFFNSLKEANLVAMEWLESYALFVQENVFLDYDGIKKHQNSSQTLVARENDSKYFETGC
jgi:hypothetical protein